MFQSMTDTELLTAFRAGSDEAFAALIVRHRPLVASVCARILGNSADCDDAVQTVFLTLARKAASLGAQETIDGWLRQTALYVAQRFRASNQLRRERENDAAPHDHEAREHCDEWLEIKPVLHGEVRALPEKYRSP